MLFPNMTVCLLSLFYLKIIYTIHKNQQKYYLLNRNIFKSVWMISVCFDMNMKLKYYIYCVDMLKINMLKCQ